MKHLFTGLWKHADFRLLWAGQTVSLLGSQITALALPVAATLTLHATAFQMGILSVAGSLPTLLFGLFIGVGVDRFRRRSLLIGADLGRAALLGSIPLAALFGLFSLGQLYIVTFLAGSLTLLFNIAHMSLLPSLVKPEQLVEGNSKLELSRSGAVIVGPGIAGLLIQLVTAPFAIVLDALSFLGSAVLLARIHTKEQAPPPSKWRSSIWSDLLTGIQTIKKYLQKEAGFNRAKVFVDRLERLQELQSKMHPVGCSDALGGAIARKKQVALSGHHEHRSHLVARRRK